EGYELADYIAIASNHVKQSFINRGFPEQKLIQNPYGVDLSMFYPTELIKENPYDIIMVGGWSLRKGCDLLVEVCRKYGYSLLHVGSIVDLEFPKDSNMTHVDSVDQSHLVNYYSQAKVFVLPSREEGLAMVQAQALVCGLPIVCSKDSGGEDLKELLIDKKWIIVASENNIEELNRCIQDALLMCSSQLQLRSYSTGVQKDLSWMKYGERYICNLKLALGGVFVNR
ncbi:MAG: glycosyltransferase family 4 protein, partial [Bacteroidota bacterium]|nr:glycosyltransferase family 4 protein [Bacteroidota bacterium]